MPDNNKIPETYVSPTLRLSFLMEDHPDAEVVYDVVAAKDSGVHAAFLGTTEWFVTCTITIPGVPQPVVAWKEVPTTQRRKENNVTRDVPVARTPELLVKLQTMCLGRALKKCGYPDDSKDFKLLLLWRQRARELSTMALGAGVVPVAALPVGSRNDAELDEAVAGAARAPGEKRGSEDDGDDIEDAEIIYPDADPAPAVLPAGVDETSGEVVDRDAVPLPPAPVAGDPDGNIGKAAAAVAALTGPIRVRVAQQARDLEINNIAKPSTEAQALTVLALIAAVAEGAM